MIILETERLYIREFTYDDAPFIIELVNNPTWLEFIGDRNVNNLDDAHRYMRDKIIYLYQQYGYGPWLLEDKHTHEPIGMCGLINRDFLNDTDIGYALLPGFTGRGLAFEAAKAVLDYGYRVLQLPAIVAITLPTNTTSIRLLQKLGMQSNSSVQPPQSPNVLSLFEPVKVNS